MQLNSQTIAEAAPRIGIKPDELLRPENMTHPRLNR